ncbi:MAG: transglutaminase domain-containing protein [Oceanospirillaceae bacterium]|nr:transglutaminase domain-containing protein [Oceanospirillaceae bacterium]MCP5335555.1 transglutaminase domain-containing protein [Oceanospirillaceae bacterium]
MHIINRAVWLPYALAQGCAFAAVLFSLFGIVPALFSAVFYPVVAMAVFSRVLREQEETNSLKKPSETIAAAGMLVFVLLLLMKGILPGLLVMMGFAMMALNMLTFHQRQILLGLTLGFVLVCAGAAQTYSGFYLLFLFAYAACAVVVLMVLRVPEAQYSHGVKNALVVTGLALLLYLIMPHLAPGMLGARPGSDYYFPKESWKNYQQPDMQKLQDSLEDLTQAAPNAETIEALKEVQQKIAEAQKAMNAPAQQPLFPQKQLGSDLDGNTPAQNLEEILLRVRAPGPMLLRTQVLDKFNGHSWQTSNQQTELKQADKEHDFIHQGKFGDVREYQVFVSHDLERRIPLAQPAVRMDFPADVLRSDAYGQWLLPDTLRAGMAYSAAYRHEEYQGHERVEFDGDLSRDDLKNYLRSDGQISAEMRALAQAWTAGANDDFARAKALQEHLQTYQYRLQSAYEDLGDYALQDFLFNTKAGHCELFATAMTLLARAENIPARYVTGFVVRKQHPVTGYFEVARLDAHAWSEVYIQNQGWLRFDATGFYELPEQASSQTYAMADDYVRQLLAESRLNEQADIRQMFYVTWVTVTDQFSAIKHWLEEKLYIVLTVLSGLILGFWVYWSYRAWVRIQWLAWQVRRHSGKQKLQDVQFYCDAIRQLQQIKKQWPVGVESIRGFAAKLPADIQGLLPAEFFRRFDGHVYQGNQQEFSEDVAQLRMIFFRLLQAGG